MASDPTATAYINNGISFSHADMDPMASDPTATAYINNGISFSHADMDPTATACIDSGTSLSPADHGHQSAAARRNCKNG